MVKIRSMMNYNHHDVQGEVFTLPSLTVPDMALSVREIMDRYTRDLPQRAVKDVFFDDDAENQFESDSIMPDFDKLDISEKYDFVEQAQENIKEYKARYENARLKDKIKKDEKLKNQQQDSSTGQDAYDTSA